MMKEQLKAFLTLEGYTAVVSNLPEFLVFLKKEYRHVSVIYIMDVDKENFYTQERYDSVLPRKITFTRIQFTSKKRDRGNAYHDDYHF